MYKSHNKPHLYVPFTRSSFHLKILCFFGPHLSGLSQSIRTQSSVGRFKRTYKRALLFQYLTYIVGLLTLILLLLSCHQMHFLLLLYLLLLIILVLLLLLCSYCSHHCCLHRVCLCSNCLSVCSCLRLLSVPRHHYISLGFQMMPPNYIYWIFSASLNSFVYWLFF